MPCEQFFFIIKDTPLIQSRVELWNFSRQFAEEMTFCLEKVDLVQKALLTIQDSESIKCMFGLILKIGNNLNVKHKN
eukprot:UN18466